MNETAAREAAAGDTPRIVVINPNSTVAVTRGIDEAIAPLRFADGPRIDCVTLAEGPPRIETQPACGRGGRPGLRRPRAVARRDQRNQAAEAGT